MFDQRKSRDDGKITEKVVMSNGSEINVRTKVNNVVSGIDIPEMPVMPSMPIYSDAVDERVVAEENYGYLQELSDSMYGGNAGNVNGASGKNEMTSKARQDLMDLIASMSEYEQRLVAETLPIDICFERIKNEIDRQRKFEKAITDAMQYR